MKRTMKNQPAEERRRITIEAVLQLAAERNPDQITTAAIAAKMKLTQGAIFRHFPSKDSLWEAVMRWVAGSLMGTINRAVSGLGPVEALDKMFMAHVDFVNAHPGVPRMLFAELQKPDATPAKNIAKMLLAEYGRKLESFLERGMSDGTFADDIEPVAAASMFIGTIQGLVMQSLISGQGTIRREDAEKVFRLYLRGLYERHNHA